MDYPKYLIRRTEESKSMDDDEVRDIISNFFNGCEKILEIGPGTGDFLRACEELGKKCVGLDISPEIAEYAKKKNIQVIEGSGTHIPFKDGSFDGLYSANVFEHLERGALLQTVKEGLRVLEKGGKALIIVPNAKAWKWKYWDDPTHVTIFTKRRSENLFNEFEKVEIEERYYIPKVKGLSIKMKIPFVHKFLSGIIPKKLQKRECSLYCKLQK